MRRNFCFGKWASDFSAGGALNDTGKRIFTRRFGDCMLKKIHVLKAIIFLSAFLLFQIELVITKVLLPKFGGSYLVWGAASVFFQGTLLIGYLYSHLVTRKFGMLRYRHYHIGLLLLSILCFPGRPLPEVGSLQHIPLVLNVFWQLLMVIGFAFFILSTTSIIFQSWLSASELSERKNPYILYGVSNLGSFAGLLTYPFLFEPFFDLDQQLLIWRLAYWVLVIFHLVAYKFISVKAELPRQEEVTSGGVSKKDLLYWFLLSAGGVALFLSVTNILTSEIAPIPLLWILPLSIYLISFVLNFKKNPWCPAWIQENFHLVVGMSVIMFFITEKRFLPFVFVGLGFLASLFIICMFCQNLLHKSKPRNLHELTFFYVMLSAGGLFGGMLVSWVVPLLNTANMVEYLIGMVIVSSALALKPKEGAMGFFSIRLVIYVICFLVLWPLVFKRYNFFGLALIIWAFYYIYSKLKNNNKAFNLSLIAILCFMPTLDSIWAYRLFIYRHRNYYGIYKIYDENGIRVLMHGTTIHGAQYLAKDRQKEALTYFHSETPIGKVMLSDSILTNRIGIIGLGTATLASYAKAGESIDYFEIDPDVYKIAKEYFTFIKDSLAKINFIFGDARLSIKNIPDKRYDLFIVDAFSGDSIPVHLLTMEALKEYKRCLNDKGVILVHISNRYLEIAPVLLSNAGALKAYFVWGANGNQHFRSKKYTSEWAALTWDADMFARLTSELKWKKENFGFAYKDFRPWTDKYSNLTRLVVINDLFEDVKQYRPFLW